MFFSALILFPFRKRIVKKFHKAIQHSKGQEDKLEKEYCLLMYLVDEFHKGRLSLKEQRDLLLPLVGKFYEIGAYSRFNQIIMELKHLDSELDYKLWRFHNCINKYDFTGMKEWLRRTEENQQKVSDKQRIQILNNLIAINCSTEITKETSSIIAELEENIFYKNIFIHEALENLRLEYENNIDIYRIDKLIIFINEFTYSSWQDYLNSFNVLYRHYQREKNIKKLQELVEIISKKSQVFKQTEEEKLIFEISLVRLLIESQMGEWEAHSSFLFQNRNKYLYYNEQVAFLYVEEFLNTNRDGATLFGRYLREEVLNEMLKDILVALDPYIKEVDEKLTKTPDDFLYVKRRLLQKKLLFIRISDGYNKVEPFQSLTKLSAIQKQILALCKKSGNNNEHIHWLLCFADDTMAFSEVLEVRENIATMANELKQIVDGYNYTPALAYYLIHLANIFDFLGDRESACNILKHYNNSGDNPNIYTLAVQSIYRKLEAKYQTRPLGPDQKIEVLTHDLTIMNRNREIKEALIIIDEKIDELILNGIELPIGINRERVLEFLYQCGVIYLNGNRFNDVIRISSLFKKYAEGWSIPHSIRIDMSLNHSKALLRKGEFDNAAKMLDPFLEETTLPNSIYFKILLLMGKIEARQAWPKLNMNTLTKALGLAESLGESLNIAEVYLELSTMLSPKFPALGLSMLTKAEIIYRELDNEELLTNTQLLKAQSCLNLYLLSASSYSEKTDTFLDEAKHIIANISKWSLKNEADKAFYDRINGVANNDPTSIWSSLFFYQRVCAKKEAYLAAESIYIVASKNGDKEEAIRGANEYLRMAQEDNDIIRINNIKRNIEGIKQGFIPEFFTPPLTNEPTTLLHILDRIAFDEELWGLDKSPIRRLFPYPIDEGKCMPMANKDGTVSLAPVCPLPFSYYRGQSKRHKPCKPTLLRDNITSSKQYLERVRYAEFHLLIDRHPITDKYVNSFTLDFPDEKKTVHYNIYHLALAQHYGIATELIDVTADKWVAAFFAATDYENDEYKIHTETNEPGIFYIKKEPFEKVELDEQDIKPIGIQPFSRPGEQRGYAYHMINGEDFESNVQSISFVHDAEINELIYNFTNRSHRLFPNDVLKEKADIIKQSRSFSEEAYKKAYQMYFSTTNQDEIDRLERLENMKHQETPVVRFTEEDMKAFRDNYPHFEKTLNNSLCIKMMTYTTNDGLKIIHPTKE